MIWKNKASFHITLRSLLFFSSIHLRYRLEFLVSDNYLSSIQLVIKIQLNIFLHFVATTFYWLISQ